jgi:hypothetical protein
MLKLELALTQMNSMVPGCFLLHEGSHDVVHFFVQRLFNTLDIFCEGHSREVELGHLHFLLLFLFLLKQKTLSFCSFLFCDSLSFSLRFCSCFSFCLSQSLFFYQIKLCLLSREDLLVIFILFLEHLHEF